MFPTSLLMELSMRHSRVGYFLSAFSNAASYLLSPPLLLGVTHVIHSASPLPGLHITNPVKELLEPAIHGTKTMIRSAAKAGTVRKLVVTSSVASIFDNSAPAGTVFNEEKWNPITWDQAVSISEEIAKTGDASQVFIVYSASKKLAEKAVWDEVEKLGKPFPVATVNPVFIFGPEILSGMHLGTGTNAFMWEGLSKRPLTESRGSLGWVDVRDVAAAHYQALIDDKANGQRFLTSTKQVTNTELIDIAFKHFDEKKLGFGKPEEVQGKDGWTVIDGSKIEKVLIGFKYRDFEQSVVDFINAKLASQAGKL